MGSLHNFHTRSLPISVLQTLYPTDIFIETGCYRGESIKTALTLNFKNIYSCDILSEHVAYCKRLFDNQPQVHVYHLDSVSFLQKVLPGLEDVTSLFFWLDAHLPFGMKDTFDSIDFPLEGELQCILEHRPKGQDVILIDDFFIYRPDVRYEKRSHLEVRWNELNDTFIRETPYKHSWWFQDNGYMLLTPTS